MPGLERPGLQGRRDFASGWRVTRRYEIQEMLSQDAQGVVFLAVDRESGADVVLRRFFPFGPGGGGLEGEERTAYTAAVERLKGVTHPALRTILDGGCDPVDGMPFLVTECVEGPRLAEHLKEKPLSPASTKALLDHALEVSQVLAGVLGEEAVWVETAPEAVILSQGQEGRSVTFWISPMRWLGHAEERQGLLPLVALGEAAMQWHGRVISDQAGDGLGAWFKAIKADPGRWTLEEARVTLHAAKMLVGDPPSTLGRASSPSVPTVSLPPPVVRQPVLKQETSYLPWVFASILVMGATGLVVWKTFSTPAVAGKPAVVAAATPQAPAEKKGPVPVASPAAPETDPEMDAAARISARAAELAKEIKEFPVIPSAPGIGDTAGIDAQLVEIGTKLRNQIGSKVTFKGPLFGVRDSDSGKTRYIEFGTSREPNAVCVRYMTKDGDADMSKDELMKLVGKQVTIQGEVVADPSGRITIDIKGRDQIKVGDS
jgi:hypothetical protein